MYEPSDRPRDAYDEPALPSGSELPSADITVEAPYDDARQSSVKDDRSRSPEPRRTAERSPLPVRRPSNAPENPPRSEVLGVFGLSVRTREIDLEDEFSKFGKVAKVTIVYDQRSDRSRGFGFVTMASVEDAQACVDNISGKDLQGRKVRVDFSITTKPHQSTPGEYMGTKRREYEDTGRGGGGGRPYDRYDRDRNDDRRPRYDDRRSDYGRRDDRDYRDSRDSRDYRDSRDSYGRSGRSDRDDYGRTRERDNYSSYRGGGRDRSPPPRRESKWSPSPPPRRARSPDSRSPHPASTSSSRREPPPPRDYDDAPADSAGPAIRW